MAVKPSYEELLKKVNELESEVSCRQQTEKTLEKRESKYFDMFETYSDWIWENVIADKTERRQSEETLQEGESKYRDLVETFNDWIWETDANGVYTYLSPKVRDVLGYEPEEMLGTKIFGTMMPNEARRVTDIFMEFAVAQKPFMFLETANLHKDGHQVVFETSGKPFFNADGKLLGFRGVARDVTERNQARKALRESEEKFRSFMETASDLMYITDKDGTLTYVNESMAKTLGYSTEQTIGMHLAELLDKEIVEKEFNQKFEALIKDGEISLETTWVTKDGRKIYGEIKVAAIYDYDGTYAGSRGVFRDLTEHKRAEKALRESESKYRDLVETVNDIIWEVNTEGFYTYVSPRVRSILGFEPEELIGSRFFELMSIGEAERLIDLYLNLVTAQKTFESLETAAIHKDGHTVILENSGKPFFNAEGKLLGYRGINRDITDRKQSESRYRLLAENVTDVIWTMDMDTKFTYVSPSVTRQRGYSVDEAMAQTIEEAMTPASFKVATTTYGEALEDERKEGPRDQNKSYTLELELNCKDGSTIWTEHTASFLRDQAGQPVGVIGITRDISERKQAEEHIRKLSQKLIKAQESERNWISRELHDRVAQDLSSSKITCDLLLDSESALSPEVMQELSVISDTLNTTIYAVRDLAYDLRPPGIEGLGLAQTTRLYCEDFSEKSGVNIGFHSAGIDNLKLSLDAEINAFRLIQEGLNNIWKHADATQATVRLIGAFPNIILRIEDNGKGFNVDQRLAAAMEEKRMGLSSIKERVSLLQGKMVIQSKPEEGTLISIKFPCEENRSESTENHIGR